MTAPLTPRPLAAARRRARWALVAGVALGSTGHIAAVTVATIVGQGHAGRTALERRARRGRRPRGGARARSLLVAAHGPARAADRPRRRLRDRRRRRARRDGRGRRRARSRCCCSGRSSSASATRSNQLSRYAAADLVPAGAPRVGDRASSSGARPSARSSGRTSRPAPATLADGARAAAAGRAPTSCRSCSSAPRRSCRSSLLRPDPYELADATSRARGARRRALDRERRSRAILRRPDVPAAIVALVTGQVVMVLIMTMTPLHMTEHGHDLGAVGIVHQRPHARDVRAVADLGPAHRPARARAR